MEIREEIRLSKGDKLPKSSSLPDSDQNKQLNNPKSSSGVKGIGRVSPMKSKVTSKSDSPRHRWIPLSERVSNKPGDIVVNAQPVSQYNPVTGQVVKESNKVQQPKVKPTVDEKDNPKEKPAGVTSKVSKGKDDVVKSLVVSDKDDMVKASVVTDEVPVVADNVPMVKATVADKALVVKAMVADNVVADKEPVKEKSAGNVGKAPVKDKVNFSVLKGSLAPGKDNVKAPLKDNVEVSVLKGSLLVDVVPDDMVLNKAMGKASVKDKFKAPVKDKVEDNVKAPVKDNVKVPVKDKPKQKVIPTVQELYEIHFEYLVIHIESHKIQSDSFESHEIQCKSQLIQCESLDNVKAPVKDKPKQKVVPTVQELSEVPVLRSKETPVKRKRILSKEDDRKKKLKGKSKKEDSDFKLETDEVVDSSSDEVDQKRKKLKIKAGLKRKRSGSDCSDSSSSIDTENIKLLISKLEKKVKKQESDEESVPKKGKKKLTKKVKKEASDEESVPKKGKKKEKKLTPEEAAHEEYLSNQLLSKLEGVPVGGYSLFDLDEREADHEFVRLWVGQFYLTELKQIRVNDIASKLVAAQEIDFLFKVNFLTLFTNTMGKAAGLKGHICLDVSSTFGEIQYFFKKAEEKLSLICAERVMLEEYMRKASLEYPGDGKFLDIHEKYVNLFKDPISFNDDRNGDNDGDDDDGNGDNDGDDDANDADGNGDEEDANEGDKDPNRSNPSFGFTKISLDDFGNDSSPTKKESVDPIEQGTVVEGNLAEECEIMSTPENYTQWLERNADLVGETIDFITVEYLYGDLFGDNSVIMEVMNQGLLTPERMLTSVYNVSPSPEKRIGKPSCYLLSLYMNKKTKVVPQIKRLEFILGNSLFAMEGDKIENVFEAHYGKFIIFGIRLNLETLALGLWLDANVIDCWGAILNHEESFRAAELKSRHFFPTGCILFARHLKLYRHIRHSKIAKVKQTIPKLKWKTKDCGLPVESQLQRDMLRRLRFKFTTKILLHEIDM
ncbi:hypothetical protein Tco_0414439 [Tanacetum coccineum]